MNTIAAQVTETDAELVAAVAALDAALARRVQLRFRSLRVQAIPHILTAPPAVEARHSVWESIRWPWRRPA